jgi:hypothetical protein
MCPHLTQVYFRMNAIVGLVVDPIIVELGVRELDITLLEEIDK